MRSWTKFLILAGFVVSASASAQTDADLAALEARLMARLERRIAEESAATTGHIVALRVAFKEAVQGLAKSRNELDQKALVAIDKGAVKDGVAVLEERAKARDSAVSTSTEPTVDLQSQKQKRADEWKRIGALAFLDNTGRAIDAYQRALTFAPDDPTILEQLGELYMRQARWKERISVGERLIALQDPEAQAKGYFNIADSHLEQAQPSKARPNVKRCLEVAQLASIDHIESRCFSLLAAANLQEQKFTDAERFATKALGIARKGGHDYEEVLALYMLAGITEQQAGRLPTAERRDALQQADRRYEDLERLVPRINDPAVGPAIVVNRARIALVLGDAALAESRLRSALATMEASGTTARISYVEQMLGTALVAQRRIDEAIPHFSNSVRKARAAKETAYEAIGLMSWAAAEAARSNHAEACRLAQESHRLYVQGAPELRVQHQQVEQAMRRFCR